MNFKKIIGIGFICFGLLTGASSCEYSYDYSYTITNKSDDTIKVTIKTNEMDSTIKIGLDESKVLFVTDHGVEGSEGPYFRDVLMDLDVCLVQKADTLKSKHDYLENDSWSFHQGDYSAIVNNKDF